MCVIICRVRYITQEHLEAAAVGNRDFAIRWLSGHVEGSNLYYTSTL